MKVLQLVPRRQGITCGVGDYAQLLSKQLSSDHRIEVRIRELNEVTTTTSSLIKLASGFDAIILQYSAYGFQKRGLPRRLLKALSEGLARKKLPPVLTMFHELEASGSIVSSSFWVGRLQLAIIRRIARLSSAIRTNREVYRKKINSLLGEANKLQIITQPVFSNLGEGSNEHLKTDRTRKLLLFQPPSAADAKNQKFWESWKKLIENLRPESTTVVGRHGHLPSSGVFDVTGVISSESVSQIFSTSRWGLMNYYVSHLAKSGGFAAHATHALVTFFPHDMHSIEDGLHCRKHYFSMAPGEIFPSEAEQQSAANDLCQWYAPHSIKATAQSYMDQLEQIINKSA